MNRPFNTRQPNLTSSDRIKNLKAKTIYKSAKSSFRHGNKKNANGKIHFTQTGTLRSTRSHELGLLLNRGYALCEDGICPPCVPDCSGQDISGTGVVPRGLFQCAKSPNWSSVTPQTENNLYTHFVSAYLPKMEGGIPFPMGAWPQDISATSGANFLQQLNWGYDPTGGPGINFSGTEHENDMDPMGYYKVNPECRRMGGGSMTFRRPATGTMIRGEQDINGHYTVCQGGNKANLTWGNNTKQNYLISYDPRNTKVRFNICEKTKDISQCYIGTPPDISNCAVVFDYSGCRICT